MQSKNRPKFQLPEDKAAFKNIEFIHPSLSIIRTLSSLPAQYPDAISLSSGRPPTKFCNPSNEINDALEAFKQHAEKNYSISYEQLLGQYGNTQGFIQDIIMKHLSIDEGIDVAAENIVITSGFQEGAGMCVSTLFEENDVLLVPDPVFNGITAIALLHHISLVSINCLDELRADDIVQAIEKTLAEGKNPKAIYVIPDFSNPQGSSMSLDGRKELLRIANKYNIFILEDNAYSYMRYEGEKIPSLKSLDKNQKVIYIGTFAKSLYPSLRMGYVVADQKTTDDKNKELRLINQLLIVKSLTSVNTPGIMQAIVGGILLKYNFSLLEYNKIKVAHYKEKRALFLYELGIVFPKNIPAFAGITWNKPQGGFFIKLRLPFEFKKNEMEECASEYGVIIIPASLFSLKENKNSDVRLSFTNESPERIKIAISRFAQYVKFKLKLQ